MVVVLCILAVGCTSVRMTMTPRSIREQRLLVLALERAVTQLDVRKYVGKRVTLELYGLSKDDLPFAREFVNIWLGKNGVHVVENREDADITLKCLAKVLAVDQAETLFGTPQFVFLGIPIPSIAIYRHVYNRGQARIQIYAFDEETKALVDELPESTGDSKHDRYTVLFVFSWTDSDIGEKLK